ncbi:MAG: ATP-binding cassette domain-containing protein [Planctomycetaceae bacterium]|nr:ATP-binding cassette domain-containing protein [Planctomycetaceae bacterium]
MTPEVELRGMDKSFGDKRLLRDFNLSLAAGQFVTAVGSSGCGKTTVLKLMNGLLSPDAGQVLFRGEDIAGQDQNRLRRRIGYVIQGTGLFPHLRIRDNIAYVLRLDGADDRAIAARVEELVEVVRLRQEILDRYPRELSGGQGQRVGLARALAAAPPLLLMDEPFGAVDDITRHELQGEMKRIHAELGITIFFITHDIAEAMSLGDKVMVMNEGRIEQFDTPERVLHEPATEYVARLLSNYSVTCV